MVFDAGAASALFLEYARRRFEELFAKYRPGSVWFGPLDIGAESLSRRFDTETRSDLLMDESFRQRSSTCVAAA